MNSTLFAIHAEFSQRCGPCVIAGGAIRDTLLKRVPRDYDVFLLNDRQPPPEWAAGLEVGPWYKKSPCLQGTVRYGGQLVQVCRSPEPSMEALVDSFDWNVCLFAWEPRAIVALTRLVDIAPGKPLTLHRCTTPLATLRRGWRFADRFSMVIDDRTLAKLCTLSATSIRQNQVNDGGYLLTQQPRRCRRRFWESEVAP